MPINYTLSLEPLHRGQNVEDPAAKDCRIAIIGDAMIAIRKEIEEIESGEMDRVNNPLKNAPHTQAVLSQAEWDKPYSRELAAFPAPWSLRSKFWPTVGRVNDALGDSNLICSCPPVDVYDQPAKKADDSRPFFIDDNPVRVALS